MKFSACFDAFLHHLEWAGWEGGRNQEDHGWLHISKFLIMSSHDHLYPYTSSRETRPLRKSGSTGQHCPYDLAVRDPSRSCDSSHSEEYSYNTPEQGKL